MVLEYMVYNDELKWLVDCFKRFNRPSENKTHTDSTVGFREAFAIKCENKALGLL